MTTTSQSLRSVVLQSLSGRGAHVLVRDAVDGLDWQTAGASAGEGTHTIFQIVNHLAYWHEFALAWIDGGKPATPEHAADSWPGGAAPESQAAWRESERRFLASLDDLEARARELELFEDRGPKTVLEILQLIASHNSYHVGQIAGLRRALGAWPPPGGGATW